MISGGEILKIRAISQDVNYPKLILPEFYYITPHKQPKKVIQKIPSVAIQNGFIVYFDGHHNMVQGLENPQLI